MDTMTTLRVNETFGPTIQGEGPYCGRRAAFLRLAGCNLDCVWCDTPYTWNWSRDGTPVRVGLDSYDYHNEVHTQDTATVLAALRNIHANLVVITGGEPMLQATALVPLVSALNDYGYLTQIETNGTRAPHPQLSNWVTYVISPKLANAYTTKPSINPTTLNLYARLDNAHLKPVVTTLDDYAELDKLVNDTEFRPEKVWVMPQGASHANLTPQLADAAIDRGYNITPRLHVNIWSDERGR